MYAGRFHEKAESRWNFCARSTSIQTVVAQTLPEGSESVHGNAVEGKLLPRAILDYCPSKISGFSTSEIKSFPHLFAFREKYHLNNTTVASENGVNGISDFKITAL
jgi:hypothetical protein